MNIDNQDQNQALILETNEETNQDNITEETNQDNITEETTNTYANTFTNTYANTFTNTYATSTDFSTLLTNNAVNRLLQSSFYDKAKYKNILSEKGKDELKTIIYTNNLQTNANCPIYQVEFTEGMEIIKLSCNHSFIPEAIHKWLSEEKAMCPVCRLELDSEEIEDTDNIGQSNEDFINSLRRSYEYPRNHLRWRSRRNAVPEQSQEEIEEPTEEEMEESETENSQLQTSNLERIATNYVYNLLNQVINEEAEQNLQQAILNSLDTPSSPS